MEKWASKWLEMFSQRQRFIYFFFLNSMGGSSGPPPMRGAVNPPLILSLTRGLRRSVLAFDFQRPPPPRKQPLCVQP